MKYFYLLINIVKRKIDLNITPPKKNSIAVVDACNLDVLERSILHGLSYTVIHIRREKLYLSLNIIIRVFLNKARMNTGVNSAYVLTMLEYIRPKVVITFNDNNNLLGICSRHYKALYLSIQNGMRTGTVISKCKLAYIPTLYCFGRSEIDLYKREKVLVDNFFDVGSIRASYYRANLAVDRPIKYDLCLVSQYRSSVVAGEYPAFKRGLDVLYEYIFRYLKGRSLRFSIAMVSSSEEGELEETYYKTIFGESVKLLYNNRKVMQSYCNVDKSNVLIGLNSTLMYEAFGWGKKVLFTNFSGDINHDFITGGDAKLPSISTRVNFVKENSFKVFERTLDQLIILPKNSYNDSVSDARKYLMNYSPNRPAHKIIRDRIIEKCGHK